MKRVIKFIIGLLGFVVLLPFLGVLWFFLFGGDYEIRLPTGYSLVRVYAGATMLTDPTKGVIIDPNIDGYKIVDNILVGHVSCDNLHLTPEDAASCKPGYFIVDMANGYHPPLPDTGVYMPGGNLKQALDEQKWIEYLRIYGITEKPKLHKPSRFNLHSDIYSRWRLFLRLGFWRELGETIIVAYQIVFQLIFR